MIGESGGRRCLALVCALVIAACAHGPSSSEDAAPPAAAEAVHADRIGRVRLDADGVARAGIRTVVVARAEGRTEVAAFGRVLDPLPLVELLQARRAARATATAARAESERVTRLQRDDQNASMRDVEGARAALAKATADVDAVAARLALGWGPAAEADDALIDDLVAGRRAILRVDVPAGAPLPSPPATVTVTGSAPQQIARVLGRAPTTDPLVQGESYLAWLDADPPRPGALLAVTLRRDPEPSAGVAVPAAAVVWIDARAAVYAEPTAGEFERRMVTLGPRRDDEWIVTSGLAPDEQVVVAGAARLLSAEVTSAEPAAD